MALIWQFFVWWFIMKRYIHQPSGLPLPRQRREVDRQTTILVEHAFLTLMKEQISRGLNCLLGRCVGMTGKTVLGPAYWYTWCYPSQLVLLFKP